MLLPSDEKPDADSNMKETFSRSESVSLNRRIGLDKVIYDKIEGTTIAHFLKSPI